MINECVALVGMRVGRGNRSTVRKHTAYWNLDPHSEKTTTNHVSYVLEVNNTFNNNSMFEVSFPQGIEICFLFVVSLN
jgi:hypothetical protein